MKNKYLKVLLASSLLCSPLFGSSSLNAMKQSYSISSQYEPRYGIDYIKKNYNMKIYTSYVPEEEFASLYKNLNWKSYSEKLIDKLEKYPINSEYPFFFLITCDDSPLAIGIIQGDICLRMIIKSEPIDGINKKYIDEFIKENYHFILQNSPPTTKTLEISKDKNTEISIINEKIDQKPILQSEHQNDNNFSIVGKSKPGWQELTTKKENNLQIKSKKNSRKMQTSTTYELDMDKYPDVDYQAINMEKLENSILNNESFKYNNTYKSHPKEYPEKAPIPEPSVNKYSRESFHKYPQNFRLETLSTKSHRITANTYTTENIKEKLLEDEEYNDLLEEQENVMQQLVDSEESDRVKNNPGKYGLRYINPGLVKVPEGYKNDEKEKEEYEIPDNIGSNNITENNIGMRRKLYSQDENNPARDYNEKLRNYSIKKEINFEGLSSALTKSDERQMYVSDYRRAQEGLALLNYNLKIGKRIKKD